MSYISAILVVSDATLANGTKRILADLPVKILVDEPSFDDWNEFCNRVESFSPDVLILEYGMLRDSIEKTMDRLKAIPRPPAVIIVHTEADAETILRVIRAGAVEYCHPPVERPIQAVVEKLLRQKAESTPSRGAGRTFGFLGAKGGVGTTILATHIALALPALLNDRVLLGDCDLSGPTIEFLLKCTTQYNVVHAMQNAHRLDESYWRALIWSGPNKLDLLAGPTRPMQRQPMPFDRLGAVLQFARHIYGASVFDLGRFLTPGVLSAIEGLDKVYIVTTLDVLALHHASKLVESMLDVGYPKERLSLIVNRVTNNRDIEPSEVQNLLGISIAGNIPEDANSLQEALRDGKLLGADSRLNQHITKMARNIVGLPTEQPKKKFSFFGAN